MSRSQLILENSVSDLQLGDCLQAEALRFTVESPEGDDGYQPIICFKHKIIRHILDAIHNPVDVFPERFIHCNISGGYNVCSANILLANGIASIMYKYKTKDVYLPVLDDEDEVNFEELFDETSLQSTLVFSDINLMTMHFI